MINFKQQDDVLPSVLIVLAVLILVGTLIYLRFVPTPSLESLGTGHAQSERRINEETQDIMARAIQTRQAVAPRLWQGDPITITAAVLAQLTAETGRHSVTLKDFRPDKSQALDGMTELRYDVQVSGRYADVRAVLASLDAPRGKVALRSIQVAASQDLQSGNTDTTGLGTTPRRIVTATAGLSAYEVSEADLPASTTPPARTTATASEPEKDSTDGASPNRQADGSEVKHGNS